MDVEQQIAFSESYIGKVIRTLVESDEAENSHGQSHPECYHNTNLGDDNIVSCLIPYFVEKLRGLALCAGDWILLVVVADVKRLARVAPLTAGLKSRRARRTHLRQIL